MARITLFPKTGSAQIDGNLATGVSYTGINPTIHCVQWYDTVGSVEYVDDPITGAKPPNQTIDSIAPYMVYVVAAETIIDAYLNPQVFYSTASEVIYQGLSYGLGDEIVISTPDTLPPAQSTNEQPPNPQDFQQLWWYNSEDTWVVSPIDPSLSLSNAKFELTVKVQESAAFQANYQARIYSLVDLISTPDVTALFTADYYGLSLGAYQTYLDDQVTAMVAQINAATTTTQLYSFDWRVQGDPNA
jgi:hypothetical protein